MRARRVGSFSAVFLVAGLMGASVEPVHGQGGGLAAVRVEPGRPWGWAVREFMDDPNRQLYNTTKAMLLEGRQVFSLSISRFDIDAYCTAAQRHEYARFEMQHSTLRFDEIEAMMAACPDARAIPFIRIPDGTEASIQKAADLGALGIIVPTIDDALEARDVARYSRFPPTGRRSAGLNPEARWASRMPPGSTFRESINDNMLIVVMIETIEAVNNALEIASVPGVDVLMIGNADLESFSGYAQGSPQYMELLARVRDAAYQAGKFWGNANSSYAWGNPLGVDSRFHMSVPVAR